MIEETWQRGLQLNEMKSKVMKIKRIKKDRTEFRVCTNLEEMNFEEVGQFVYLGALITNRREEVKEIDVRLSKVNSICWYHELSNKGKTAVIDNEI